MDKNKNIQKRSIGSISWKEREEMIELYLTGQYTKAEIWFKYTGSHGEHGNILKWMRRLGYETEFIVRQRQQLPILAKQASKTLKKDSNYTNPEKLRRRIAELEKQLEDARIKAEGYQLMIEIAEKELKIPIRKKSDTK